MLNSCWALAAVSELDLVMPGLAGSYIRASDERRQVVAAFLSTLPFKKRRLATLPDDPDEKRRIAHLLFSGTHQSILRAAFERIPAGFRQALGRSGPISHPPQFYVLLRHLLNQPRRHHLANVIRQMRDITLTRLVVLCVLPQELQNPALIANIRDQSEARDIARAINLLRIHAIDGAAFEHGLRAIRRKSEVRDFLRAWVLRCRFAPSPVPASDRYRAIVEGPTLKAKALEYQNCSRDYSLDLLEGCASLAEFTAEEGSAIVMLIKRKDVWVLDEVYGHQNGDVDDTLRAKAIDHLRLHGIEQEGRPSRKDSPFSSLRRLMPRGVWV